jgi:hypothetical protein
LFKNCKTGKILFPDKFEYGVRKYSPIPQGTYDVILLYNNGKYLKCDNVPLSTNTYTEVNMRKQDLHESDSLSMKWLALRTYSREAEIRKPATTYSSQSTSAYQSQGSVYETFYTKPASRNAGNLIKGTIVDQYKEPLIGVSVQIKGTTYGTISDIDGNFDIDISGTESTLIFSYIGYVRQEITIKRGSNIIVTLKEDNRALEEVVVVGYGISRRQNMTGAVSSVTTSDIASERSAPQSPPEETEDTETAKSETEKAEEQLYNELLQLNGLRTNFSDVGFWEPRLYTDRKG